jgi:hypothetical protein
VSSFLTPAEARERWGDKINPPGAVKTWNEFEEPDGRWRPLFNIRLEWVGYVCGRC